MSCQGCRLLLDNAPNQYLFLQQCSISYVQSDARSPDLLIIPVPAPGGKTNMKEGNQLLSHDATRHKQPKQLLELAGLEIRRREILKDLASVEREMYRLNPGCWASRFRG
jgi:hypothetical protein